MIRPTFWQCWVQGACTVPGLCSCSSEVSAGFLSFCIFLSIICPNCAAYAQLFLVPYSFFVFCCLKKPLVRCKNCSKGSQVSACLSVSFLSRIVPYGCANICMCIYRCVCVHLCYQRDNNFNSILEETLHFPREIAIGRLHNWSLLPVLRVRVLSSSMLAILKKWDQEEHYWTGRLWTWEKVLVLVTS